MNCQLLGGCISLLGYLQSYYWLWISPVAVQLELSDPQAWLWVCWVGPVILWPSSFHHCNLVHPRTIRPLITRSLVLIYSWFSLACFYRYSKKVHTPKFYFFTPIYLHTIKFTPSYSKCAHSNTYTQHLDFVLLLVILVILSMGIICTCISDMALYYYWFTLPRLVVSSYINIKIL